MEWNEYPWWKKALLYLFCAAMPIVCAFADVVADAIL